MEADAGEVNALYGDLQFNIKPVYRWWMFVPWGNSICRTRSTFLGETDVAIFRCTLQMKDIVNSIPTYPYAYWQLQMEFYQLWGKLAGLLRAKTFPEVKHVREIYWGTAYASCLIRWD